MFTPVYRCDGPGCDNVKGEVNHWWRVHVGDPQHVYIHPWNSPAPSDLTAGERHACGESCLHKIISDLLNNGEHSK